MDMVRVGAEHASQMYYRLLVVEFKDESKGGRFIAEGLGMRRINVGEQLGAEMLEIPAKRRPLEVARLLEKHLGDVGNNGVLLDHIEILFEATLKVEPLTLLMGVSRRHPVVVMWRGEIEAGNLLYGFPGHPEYRSYPAREVTLVRFPE